VRIGCHDCVHFVLKAVKIGAWPDKHKYAL
jgi:hypothetical protein